MVILLNRSCPKKYVLYKPTILSFDRHLNEHTVIKDKSTTNAKSKPFKHVPVPEEETTKHEQKPDTKIVIDTIKLNEKQNQHTSAKEEKEKSKKAWKIFLSQIKCKQTQELSFLMTRQIQVKIILNYRKYQIRKQKSTKVV